MAKGLEFAIAEIQRLVGEVNGIRFAPSETPEKTTIWPIAIVILDSGSYTSGGEGDLMGLHNIIVAIHYPRKDLPRALAKMIPFGDLVAKKLQHSDNAYLGGTVNTTGQLTYDFRYDMTYAEVSTLGWLFSWSEIKIESF